VAKASIIIPCHNLGAYLDDAVTSALEQTVQDVEILLIDDGSTDQATIDKLGSFKDPRVKTVRRPHCGVTATRNFGLEACSGQYLSFLDADDRLAPTFLERVIGQFEARPELAFVAFWVELFGEESWVWKCERCDLRALLTDCSIGTATAVRRSAALAVGGFDVDMELGHEDWALWLSLVERGFQGTIIPEVLFHYRVRSQSRSTIANLFGIYLQLFRQRIRKHRESYEQLLCEVLCDMEERNLNLGRAARSATRAVGSVPAAVTHSAQDRSATQSGLPATSITRRGLTLVVPGSLTPAARAEKLARLRAVTSRPVELVAVDGLPRRGARNRALQAASQPYVVFVHEDDPLQTSFFELSCCLLDEKTEVSFVGSWGSDGLCEVDPDAPRECNFGVMLSRPWMVHLPTVFRRELWSDLNGFDEAMGMFDEPDFFLRALANDAGGRVIESRFASARLWGERPSALTTDELERALRPFFERHRRHFVSNLEAVIIAGQRRFLHVNSLLKSLATTSR
jgi:glycosyltransferase involved in cell wall biosynthesis